MVAVLPVHLGGIDELRVLFFFVLCFFPMELSSY